MRLRALGSSGSGTRGRRLSSFLLDDSILLDAGGVTDALDPKKQFLIEHVFITHAHLDHIQGIPFLADNFALAGRDGVNVYSLPVILGKLKKHVLNGSIWPDFSSIPGDGRPTIRLMALEEGVPVRLERYDITALRVRHAAPAVGYLARHTKTGKSLFYTGDTGPGSGVWKKLAAIALNCLIVDVSFPDEMEELAIASGHLTPKLLGNELKQLSIPPRRIFITHLKAAFFKTIVRQAGRLGLDNLDVLPDGQVIRIF